MRIHRGCNCSVASLLQAKTLVALTRLGEAAYRTEGKTAKSSLKVARWRQQTAQWSGSPLNLALGGRRVWKARSKVRLPLKNKTRRKIITIIVIKKKKAI